LGSLLHQAGIENQKAEKPYGGNPENGFWCKRQHQKQQRTAVNTPRSKSIGWLEHRGFGGLDTRQSKHSVVVVDPQGKVLEEFDSFAVNSFSKAIEAGFCIKFYKLAQPNVSPGKFHLPRRTAFYGRTEANGNESKAATKWQRKLTFRFVARKLPIRSRRCFGGS
jgi:hypothetical protein